MSVPQDPGGVLPRGDGIATRSQVPEKSSSYATAIAPAAHEGGAVTLQAPQPQALLACGPSTRSWAGAASNPEGQDDPCEGAKATRAQPLGTTTQGPAAFVHASGGAGPTGGPSGVEASWFPEPGPPASPPTMGCEGGEASSPGLASSRPDASGPLVVGALPSPPAVSRPPRPS